MLGKIAAKLLEMTFCDVANMDDVTITTSPTGNAEGTTHIITLVSGMYNNQTETIEGKDAGGNNIHLPKKYIIDID